MYAKSTKCSDSTSYSFGSIALSVANSVRAVWSEIFRRRIVSIRSAWAGVSAVGVSSHPNTRNASSTDASRAAQITPTDDGSGCLFPLIQSLIEAALIPERRESSALRQSFKSRRCRNHRPKLCSLMRKESLTTFAASSIFFA